MGEIDISRQEVWARMQEDASSKKLTDDPPLKSGGGGGTYDDMSIVDAKIAAAEARTDTKFAELIGELKAIETSTAGIKTTVVVTGIAAVALVVAIFGWGSQMFGVGMNTQSISDQSAKNVLEQAQPKFDAIQTQFKDLNARFDAVIHALDNRQQGSPAPEFQIEPSPKQ